MYRLDSLKLYEIKCVSEDLKTLKRFLSYEPNFETKQRRVRNPDSVICKVRRATLRLLWFLDLNKEQARILGRIDAYAMSLRDISADEDAYYIILARMKLEVNRFFMALFI
jgi:hypothetical protein